MYIPLPITRISRFPRAAVVLLQRVPRAAGRPYDITDLFKQEPEWHAHSSDHARPPEDADDSVEWAITAAGESYFRSTLASNELRRYWRYCRACAVASDELARQGGVNRALAYSAGLLHDIGRLALTAAYPNHYANLLDLTQRMIASGESFELLRYERNLFGIDRFAAAAWLADTWDLPPSLRETVGRFAAPDHTRELDLSATVRLGCQISCSLGFGLMPGASQEPPAALLRQLPAAVRLRWSDLNQLSEQIKARLQ